MKAQIRGIIAKHGRLPAAIDTIGDADDLHAAGLTSFGSVEIMMALEEAFDIEFPDRMMNRRNFASVDAIEAALLSIKHPQAA